MIAYHYPPVWGSSGVQRTLKFSRYLLDHGWEPLVLTVHPRAYQEINAQQMGEVPQGIEVTRAQAWDTARHFAIKGTYPGHLALPDRWVSWILGGTISGLKLIRKYQPDAIWSTYPIASAHLLGLTLHRLSGIPWVADFRDSMSEDNYPSDPQKRAVYQWIERKIIARSHKAVFTTPGAKAMYAARYPDVPQERWAIIENGYDEENFTRAEQANKGNASHDDAIVLVHSGILYPSERDPRSFFAALANLKQGSTICGKKVRVVLRATGHDDYYRELIAQCGLGDIVFLEPGLPYQAALQEMLAADGLLLFQAANCNHQIPAKLYEYLRARRPVLALTDDAGDTARLLRHDGIDTITPLDDEGKIAAALTRFLTDIECGKAPIADDDVIIGHSRESRTAELARLLDSVIGQ